MINVSNFTTYTSFLEYYSKKICPALREIDISLKYGSNIDVSTTSQLLHISEEEVHTIIKKLSIKNISKENFLKIMFNGTSFICSLYKREIECGCPKYYTPSQLSYIYCLDTLALQMIYNDLNIQVANTEILPTIFKKMGSLN